MQNHKCKIIIISLLYTSFNICFPITQIRQSNASKLDFYSIKPAISQLNLGQLDKNSFNKIKQSKIKINSEFSFDKNYELSDNFILTGNVKDTEYIHNEKHKISKLNFHFSYNI